MYRYVFVSALLLLITARTYGVDQDIEILRQLFVKEQMNPKVDVPEIRQLMTSISEDGTWPDINYQDVSKTGFQHGRHLDNMVKLGRAFKNEDSELRGDNQLKKVIDSSLNYWIANDFICENWWWNQIGTPGSLVSLLLIMDRDLTKEQISKTLLMAGRANLNATGARPSGDRIKIAGILAKTLLFRRDEVQFKEVIKVIEGEIKFATGRGMQYDYSFHHREDRVNNTLSYGTGYADAFAEWAANVAGTKYKFSEKSLQQLIDYYLDGICKMMIFGKSPDPGAMNRDITRADAHRSFGTATIERLLKSSDYRKKEMLDLIGIRKGEAVTTLSYCAFFWQSEHFTFQRPGFFTSVRMYSTRCDNMEQPYNGEGLMNHHRGDGTNYLSRTGNEYTDISPVYDWQKIPGTTILQKPSLPSENKIQKKGLTDFVGAVTDGKYGAAAFDFKSPHDPLAARKGWFFFDNEYVCLGAGISSDSKLEVVTTLNQCLLHNDVVMMSQGTKSVVRQGVHALEKVTWIFHDGTGYLFPEPQRLNLSNQTEKGSWFKINHQSDSPKEEITKDVFKLWLTHGQQPHNATYQYIVVPATSEKEMSLPGHHRRVEILSNTTALQAVKHPELGICEAIFYQPGEIQVLEGLKIGMEDPGVLLVKTVKGLLKKIVVADPTRKLEKLHLTITGRFDISGDFYHSTWNKEKGISEIVVDLPKTVFAGKSVIIEL